LHGLKYIVALISRPGSTAVWLWNFRLDDMGRWYDSELLSIGGQLDHNDLGLQLEESCLHSRETPDRFGPGPSRRCGQQGVLRLDRDPGRLASLALSLSLSLTHSLGHRAPVAPYKAQLPLRRAPHGWRGRRAGSSAPARTGGKDSSRTLGTSESEDQRARVSGLCLWVDQVSMRSFPEKFRLRPSPACQRLALTSCVSLVARGLCTADLSHMTALVCLPCQCAKAHVHVCNVHPCRFKHPKLPKDIKTTIQNIAGG
jgi:hypothetical protein